MLALASFSDEFEIHSERARGQKIVLVNFLKIHVFFPFQTHK